MVDSFIATVVAPTLMGLLELPWLRLAFKLAARLVWWFIATVVAPTLMGLLELPWLRLAFKLAARLVLWFIATVVAPTVRFIATRVALVR